MADVPSFASAAAASSDAARPAVPTVAALVASLVASVVVPPVVPSHSPHRVATLVVRKALQLTRHALPGLGESSSQHTLDYHPGVIADGGCHMVGMAQLTRSTDVAIVVSMRSVVIPIFEELHIR